jgi:hypothetical protein
VGEHGRDLPVEISKLTRGAGSGRDAHRSGGDHPSLVNEIVLTPEGGELKVDLRGDLAGILAIAASGKKPAPGGNGFSDKRDGKTQFDLVAGVGFEPTTFRL